MPLSIGDPSFMMVYLRKTLEHLLFSNIFIAIGAVSAMQVTYFELGYGLQWDFLTLLIFSGTLFIYIFQRFISLGTIDRQHLFPRQQYYLNNKNLLKGLMVVSLLCILWALFHMPRRVFIALPFAGVIALFYDIPFKSMSWYRVRDIAYIKIFLIAIAWAYVCVLLPVVYLGGDITDSHIVLIFFERALFVFAITLPFDIRDQIVDAQMGVKTIPGRIGPGHTRVISFICLLVAAVITLYLHLWAGAPSHFMLLAFSLVFSYLITALVIYAGKEKYPDYYYLGALDGMLILQGIMTCLALNLPGVAI